MFLVQKISCIHHCGHGPISFFFAVCCTDDDDDDDDDDDLSVCLLLGVLLL